MGLVGGAENVVRYWIRWEMCISCACPDRKQLHILLWDVLLLKLQYGTIHSIEQFAKA